jgi:hypothetical protein
MTTDDSHSEARTRTILVANGPFRVESCGCGTLHIRIGAVTIRLPPTAFESLATTLMQAADQLSLPGTATRH